MAYSLPIHTLRLFYNYQGGKKNKFSILLVFSFVALWHDLKLKLLFWAWFIVFIIVIEKIII